MPAAPASLAAARAAKARLAGELAGVPGIAAVGLTKVDGGWAVKIEVSGHRPRAVPAEVDGVEVIVAAIGDVSKLAPADAPAEASRRGR